MMKCLQVISQTIDKINEWVGRIVSYIALLLMLLMVYEVVTRRLLNTPSIWTFETVVMMFGFYLMMVAGYGLLKGGMVSVDVFSIRFSIRTQKKLQVLSYLIFFFPFMICTFLASIDFAVVSWASKEASWSVWAPPLYPFKTVVPVSLFFLLIQGVSEFIKNIMFLQENR